MDANVQSDSDARAGSAADIAFLTACVGLSSGLFIGRLGLWSDDWMLLALMHGTAPQSIPTLFLALYSDWTAMRPGQLIYMTLLYRAFGLQPLGYHLVNHAVLTATGIFAYLALRTLGVRRALALAVALVFVLLPHYSSDRLWIAASNITLSMALYFASLYAGLQALAASTRARFALLLAGSLAALVFSGLCYELAIPLFVMHLVLMWRALRVQPAAASARARGIMVLSLTAISILAVAAFKFATTVRLGADRADLPRSMLRIVRGAFLTGRAPGSFGLNVADAIQINVVEFVTGWPAAVLRVIGDGHERPTLLIALLVATLVWTHVSAISRRTAVIGPRSSRRTRADAIRLIGVGSLLFWLGYGIFLTNSNVQFTLTGIGNRVNIAAAVGLAMIVAGTAAGWSSWFRSSALRTHAFAGSLALLCAVCVLMTNVIANQWVRAYVQQRKVLDSIRTHVPQLPRHSTLILDGVCPYVGPAIVFDSSWDLAGALRILYRDSSLNADVATTQLRVQSTELTTSQYGDVYHYPFGAHLFVYDYAGERLHPLLNVEVARQYFGHRQFDVARDCPEGREGLGARAW